MNKMGFFGLCAAVALGAGITYWSRTGGDHGGAGNVRLPARFTGEAIAGSALFEANCQACHGRNAAGTKKGPPLINKIYRPNHHPDRAFYRAARYGSIAHHWRFGNMPPVKGVTAPEVTKIIAYVRELQRANGIF